MDLGYRDSLLDIHSLPIINGFESVGLAAKSACDQQIDCRYRRQ